MRSRRSLLLVTLAVFLAGGSYAVFQGRYDTGTTPALEITSSRLSGIGALGTLEPASRVRVVSAPGMAVQIADLRVKEGDDVAPADVLALTDEYELRTAELRQAESQVRVARARLEQTKAGSKPEEIAALQEIVKAARETHAQRRRDLDRSQSLSSSRVVAASEFEQQRLAVASSSFVLAEAEARLAAINYVRDVDLRLREAELASAEDSAVVARKAADRTQIRSPIRGRVLRVHTRAGERIGDRGVLELGDVVRMHAVAEVYEADVPRVSLGMRATASVKSTGIVLRGTVVKIEPLVGRKVALDNDPVTDTDARVVEVRVELDAEDSIRVAALTNARVEIVIGRQ